MHGRSTIIYESRVIYRELLSFGLSRAKWIKAAWNSEIRAKVAYFGRITLKIPVFMASCDSKIFWILRPKL